MLAKRVWKQPKVKQFYNIVWEKPVVKDLGEAKHIIADVNSIGGGDSQFSLLTPS